MSDDAKDPFKIEDPSILTWVEQKLIGSTVENEAMIRNPFTPQAILEGKPAKDVFASRAKQREIVSMQSESFGLEIGRLPIIALNFFDRESGSVERGEVRLTGIYDYSSEKINRDPKELSKYRLTEEGRRKFMVEDQVGRREKIG